MSHRELYPTVGKLPPVFDHGRVPSLRELIEDFTSLSSRRIEWQRVYLPLLRARHQVSQIARAN
jgi:hypothetical protein